MTLSFLFIAGSNNSCTGPDSGITHPLRSVVNLSKGESQKVQLVNGEMVDITLIEVKEFHDELRDAVREAHVKVSVDGEEITIISGNYYLPQKVGNVKIDCPATGGYVENVRIDNYGFDKDTRIRDRKDPEKMPPTIHAAYHPSQNIKPGDSITFKVRTFRSETGHYIITVQRSNELGYNATAHLHVEVTW